jgi:polyisoprenoid-binding protein YceI
MKATLDATKTAQVYAIDKMHSEVAFQVRHLLTKVRGRFRNSRAQFCSTGIIPNTRPCR